MHNQLSDNNLGQNDLIRIGAYLHQRGWVPATSGNLSLRLPDGHILITASGRHKGYLQANDFLCTNAAGDAVTPGKPSAETLLHIQLYRFFPETNCVLHYHSPLATVLSRFYQTELLKLEGYELLKAFPGMQTHNTSVSVPLLENSQDMHQLTATIEPLLSQATIPVYLIRGHGSYVWGSDVNTALNHLEAWEFLLECEYKRLLLKQI